MTISCNLLTTVLTVTNRMAMSVYQLLTLVIAWLMGTAVSAQHHGRGWDHSLLAQDKIQIQVFKIWFLIYVYSFPTTIKSKNCNLNPGKLGVISSTYIIVHTHTLSVTHTLGRELDLFPYQKMWGVSFFFNDFIAELWAQHDLPRLLLIDTQAIFRIRYYTYCFNKQ